GTRLVSEAVDRGSVTVGGNEGVQRLNEMPRWAIDPRFIGGVNVFARTASPALAARVQFELHNTFRAQRDRDHAVEALGRGRHEDASAAGERGLHGGLTHN